MSHSVKCKAPISFLADTNANIGMLFAILMVPLISMIGAAVDFGVALNVKAKLSGAADAAALAGLAAAQNSLAAGNVSTAATATGEGAALGYFNATVGNMNGTFTSSASTVSKSGASITSTFEYGFSSPTYLMPILGIDSVPLRGSATATATLSTYVNIYILIDNSQSMGVGATASDQQIIYNESKNLKSNDDANTCAFACHFTDSSSSDISSKVRQSGASLRIDVAKKAVDDALATLPSNSTVNVAIYTFANKLVNVVPLTKDMAVARAAVAPKTTSASSIDLANGNNDGGTNISYALTSLNSALPTPGNGVTAATAQGYVILVTDGVQDSDMKYLQNGNYADKSDPNFVTMSPCLQATCQYFSNFGVTMQSMDPAQCSAIKNKGYSLMTLNVKYIVPGPSYQSKSANLNSVFAYIKTYLLNSIPTNMSSCASSPSFAYSVDTPAEITQATASIFGSIGKMSQARLSQ